MNIQDFKSIRVGSGYPRSVDVEAISSHESYGVLASTDLFPDRYDRIVELRMSADGFRVALFTEVPDESVLPKYWQGSSVLWSKTIEAKKS